MSELRLRAGALLERVGGLACRATSSPSPRRLLAAAVLMGAALRVAVLLVEPVSPHEAHYLRDARHVLEAGSVRAMSGSVHGWLAALGYAAVLERFPAATERDLRWVQLTCSLLAMCGTWGIARAAAADRAAAAAVMVQALTPSAIFYGASAEPYSSHLLLVTILIACYVRGVRRGRFVDLAALSVVSAAATLHHLVAAVNALALVGHAAFGGRATARVRVARMAPLLVGVAAVVPMAAVGNPGHARQWLGATIPYFFSVAVVGSIVVFAALHDEVASELEPAWREVLPWCLVAPVLFWLPYGRLQYLLPCVVPMSVVLGAALVAGARPRVVGAVVLFTAWNAVSAVADVLHRAWS